MFEHHFGLRENPFVAGHHAKFVYPSPEHQEALAHLRFGIENREPFVLITGEVGTGKTTALYDALSEWQSRVVVALINNSALSRNELLEEIALRFGVPISGPLSKPQVLAQLERALLGIHQRGERAILLLDEAQNLERDLLEEIRLLSNLESTGQKLLQVFLVGQPELEVKLARNELRQLRQRITVHYRLNPLSAEDTERYIHHRISVAGGHALTVFPPDACLAVHRLTHGIPREINNVCAQALLNAFVDDARSVAPSHVSGAAQETEFTSVMERDDSPAFAHREDEAPREVSAPAAAPVRTSAPTPAPVRANPPETPVVDAYGPTPLDDLEQRAHATPTAEPKAEAPPRAHATPAAEPKAEVEPHIEPEIPADPEPEDDTPFEIPAIDAWMSSNAQRSDSRAATPEPAPPTPVAPTPPLTPIESEATTAPDRPPSLPAHAQPDRVTLPPGGGEIPRLPSQQQADVAPIPAPPEMAPPIAAPPIAKPPAAAPRVGAPRIAPIAAPPIPKPPVVAPQVAAPAAARQSAEPAPRLIAQPTPPRAAEPAPAPPRRSLADEQRAALPPRLRAKLDQEGEHEELAEHEEGGLPRPMLAIGAIVVIAIAVLLFVRFGPLTHRVTPPAIVEPATSTHAIPQPPKISSASTGAPAVSTSPSPNGATPNAGAPVSTTSPVAAKTTAPSPTVKATTTAPASQTASPMVKVPMLPKPSPKVIAKPSVPRATFGVAVATYLSEERAATEREKLAASSGMSGRVVAFNEDGSEVYRVVLGSYADRSAAERGASDLIRKGLVDEARVISLGRAKP